MKMPQECPSCKADLRDRNPRIPAGYEEAFSLVLADALEFQCPVCGYRWPRESVEAEKKFRAAAVKVLGEERRKRQRSGNPAKRNAR